MRAAEIYEDAFRQKFEFVVRSQQDRIAILAASLNPDLVVVAVDGDRVVGFS